MNQGETHSDVPDDRPELYVQRADHEALSQRAAGMSSAEIGFILAQRRRGEMRRRWAWVTASMVALVLLAFVAIPAMLDPVRALRLQLSGIEAQALVTHADDAPPVCDSSGCMETPYAIMNLKGGTVPPQILASDLSSPIPEGSGYLLGPIERHIASAVDVSRPGDSFPVWFVPTAGFPQDLTTDQPQTLAVSGLVSWWWLVIPLLVIALYPRIDALLFRRGATK